MRTLTILTAGSIRAFLFGGLIAVITTGVAAGQTTTRPPVGGVGSPPDAMIFYVAHGAADACGPGCSDWIAAEGTVQFDTNRRLIAILDRQAGRKLPLVIHAWGRSSFNTATKMGRILRDRGIDATAGATDVEACHDKAEVECFALKRPGGPLDAAIKTSDTACDIACVLMLAGAVHRKLPPTTRVILTGMTIFNRLAPNVSEEEREGATAIFGQQFRLYLREMGVQTELMDIIDRNSASRKATELPPSEWIRLGSSRQCRRNIPAMRYRQFTRQPVHRPAAAYNMLAGQEGDAGRVAQTMTAARRAHGLEFPPTLSTVADEVIK